MVLTPTLRWPHFKVPEMQADALRRKGNSNADSMVQHKLQQTVVAHYVRLVPVDWNPSGRIGLRLEMYGCPYISDVAHLDGRSALLYALSPAPGPGHAPGRAPRPPPAPRLTVLSLQFKTLRNTGTVLHAWAPGGHGFSLSLERGRLLLRLQLPGAEVSPGGQQQQQQHQLAVGSLLDDQHWHRVRVEHFRAHLNMTVDSNTRQTHVPTQLTLWDIQQGNVTFSCAEPLSIATTFAVPHVERRRAAVDVPPARRPGAEEEDEEVWLYLRKARLHLESRRARGSTTLELGAGQYS
ncbi:hypothetical protein CRUP_037705 [Coryphaenoides rupestris]|nr:hypothetical protein CRUP_037705 [Coryphaenoides rupestris]